MTKDNKLPSPLAIMKLIASEGAVIGSLKAITTEGMRLHYKITKKELDLIVKRSDHKLYIDSKYRWVSYLPRHKNDPKYSGKVPY